MDETEALRAEVAELRSEVERLRAWQAGHSCAPSWQVPHWGNPAAACTCGSTAGCAAHPAPKPPTIWCNTYPAAGCAGGYAGNVYTVLPGDPPLNIRCDTFGAAPQPVFTFPVPG